jgi:hypothetical protein
MKHFQLCKAFFCVYVGETHGWRLEAKVVARGFPVKLGFFATHNIVESFDSPSFPSSFYKSVGCCSKNL